MEIKAGDLVAHPWYEGEYIVHEFDVENMYPLYIVGPDKAQNTYLYFTRDGKISTLHDKSIVKLIEEQTW